jgi:uroporphyrinogen-III decarboxylase
MDQVERSDYNAEVPTLYLADGSRIECTRDDDAYYKPADRTNGFILSSACSVAPPVPPDNIMRMVDLCHHHVRS